MEGILIWVDKEIHKYQVEQKDLHNQNAHLLIKKLQLEPQKQEQKKVNQGESDLKAIFLQKQLIIERNAQKLKELKNKIQQDQLEYSKEINKEQQQNSV